MEVFQRVWQRAIGDALERLAAVFAEGHFVIGKRREGKVQAIMEHEACVLPGMLALGMTQGAIGLTRIW